jgi:hypothetical protein
MKVGTVADVACCQHLECFFRITEFRPMIRSMKIFLRLLCFWAATFLFLVTPGLTPTASFTVDRERWEFQAGSTNIPLFFRLSAVVLGNGLRSSTLVSPAQSNAMIIVGSYQASWSSNYPAITAQQSNVVSGAELFRTDYPTGKYSAVVRVAVTNPITQNTILTTNTWQVAAPFEFSPVSPNVTSPTMFQTFMPTQVFAWRFYSTNRADSISFALLEGKFDTNTLSEISTNGISYLTNLTILAAFNWLSSTQTSVSVSGINPDLDHITVLEFHRTINSNQVPVLRSDSVIYGLALFLSPPPGANTNAATLQITKSSTNTVLISWDRNAGSNYLALGTTNLGQSMSPMSTNPKITTPTPANYEMVIPIGPPQQFLQLRQRSD